jgi:uncharacterized protein (TIGR02599 family)
VRIPRQGWTLAELMVSTAILAVLLTGIAQSLAVAQRAWLSARVTSAMTRAAEDVHRAVAGVRHATLQSRPAFDPASNELARDSDLHFVCGAAGELIPLVPGACGDAVFFQRPAPAGPLQCALQASGLFVQYGDDDAYRPRLLHDAPVRKRFRLLQFHQDAEQLAVFRPSAPPPIRRADCYTWFAHPLSLAPASPGNISVVAENVVFMMLQAVPGDQGCYDTRRYQWDGGTMDADASRNRLPRLLEATLLMTDEAGWSKLGASGIDAFAQELINMARSGIRDGKSPETTLAALRAALETRGMRTRRVAVAIPMSRDT